MTDRLLAMQVFARVARLEGFAAAARELHISATAVSRHVAMLEEHLDVRLLRRSTRRVSLTEAGAAYLERCERLLADLIELEEGVTGGRHEPRGRLRISAGVSFAQEQLGALMPEFLARHPELEVELRLSDRHVDLVGEGFDLAVRIGRLPDSSLFAKKLCPSRHVLCAAPSYIATHGEPQTPAQAREHACIVDTNQTAGWEFMGPDGPVTHRAEGRYRVNSAHASSAAAIAGLGLAYLPTFVAGPRLASGELTPLLPAFRPIETSVYAVYPENRYLSAGVRAFIDLLVERFGEQPPWDRWFTDANGSETARS